MRMRAPRASLRARAASLVYTAPVRGALRRVMEAPAGAPVRRAVEARGLEGQVRRAMSERLPAGSYYAKLTVGDWQRYRGRSFRLYQGAEVVYGNEIEPPARGSALEYRNIVVTSPDPKDFRLDIDAPFSLKIGHGAFTTPQQVTYDAQYGVEQHGDVFYSVRGNTTNPTRLLVTFPGFGPSTSRVSYAVSYLKELTDEDLASTMMICFQDRYLVSGSYMLVDNGGRPLYDRVHAVIDEAVQRHGIAAGDVMFFGASKGGSIAISYAREFPAARLLLAVPQMNLPYYFNKPFFKDSLFRHPAFREAEQPQDLLRRYFAEGRTIDYFYTNDDELSNHSLVELVRDVENLTKYRVGGVHGAVAKNALPAILGLIRGFLAPRADRSLTCGGVRTFVEGGSVRLQVRLDGLDEKLTARASWFVEGSLGRTRFLQIMSDHRYPFVKYMDATQRLSPAYDRLADIDRLTVVLPSGDRYSGPLPEAIAVGGSAAADLELDPAPLRLDSDAASAYVVLDDDRLGRFRYRSREVAAEGDALEVRLVAGPVDGVPLEAELPGARYVAVVESSDDGELVELLALRLVVAAGVDTLRVVVDEGAVPPEAVRRVAELGWDDVRVVLANDDGVVGNDASEELAGLISAGRVEVAG
ncbi:hypothetical protein [Krasilnikoviella flava]|uniref:Uncharacterized protein n=1 Tax=Krasilnikoviella flava TaxID=526729 RepID=A0A1T5IIH0_9MICO|nr:hypothetical protein [Krasilnikoviella flava]SKC38937.1 hypothetical protein SAMN04324258_0568 [Krasilnikoviella flava]